MSLFDNLFGQWGSDMAIDLGTANTLVAIPGEGIVLNNKAGVDIDTDDLISRVLTFGADAKVLIIHTHGSEAYTPEPGWEYEPSDPYRTEDGSMIYVPEE